MYRVHQVPGQMLHTAEIDMAESVTPNDAEVFFDNKAWAIHFTYHTVALPLLVRARGNCLTKKIKDVQGKTSVLIFRV